MPITRLCNCIVRGKAPFALLPTRGERPRRRVAEKADELSPPHVRLWRECTAQSAYHTRNLPERAGNWGSLKHGTPLVPEAKVHHAAAGDPAGWLCFLSRSASAMNRMPKMIE